MFRDTSQNILWAGASDGLDELILVGVLFRHRAKVADESRSCHAGGRLNFSRACHLASILRAGLTNCLKGSALETGGARRALHEVLVRAAEDAALVGDGHGARGWKEKHRL